MFKSSKLTIVIFLFSFLCTTHAQSYIFFPTKNDFHIYDTKKNLIIKDFDYMHNAVKGVLWRPTDNLGYIFLKNMPQSSQIIRMKTSDQSTSTFIYPEAFFDFQVLKEDLLVIKTTNSIALWSLGSKTPQVLLKNFIGSYFMYDEIRKVLITQDPSNMIALHTTIPHETTQILDRAHEGTFFTLNQGKLAYMNSPNTWVIYDLDTQEITHHKLSYETNLVAIWLLKTGSFFIQQAIHGPIGKRPGTRFFIYDPNQQLTQEVASEQPGYQSQGSQIITSSLIKIMTSYPAHLGTK